MEFNPTVNCAKNVTWASTYDRDSGFPKQNIINRLLVARLQFEVITTSCIFVHNYYLNTPDSFSAFINLKSMAFILSVEKCLLTEHLCSPNVNSTPQFYYHSDCMQPKYDVNNVFKFYIVYIFQMLLTCTVLGRTITTLHNLAPIP